jgi:hypothetical protein
MLRDARTVRDESKVAAPKNGHAIEIERGVTSCLRNRILVRSSQIARSRPVRLALDMEGME